MEKNAFERCVPRRSRAASTEYRAPSGRNIAQNMSTMTRLSSPERITVLRFCSESSKTQLAMVANRVRHPAIIITAKAPAMTKRATWNAAAPLSMWKENAPAER